MSNKWILRAFGVSGISVKRAVKRYQEEGIEGFYPEKKTRGAVVLSTTVLKQARQLLDEGQEPAGTADQSAVKRDTPSKAIRAGRLCKTVKKTVNADQE